MRNLEHVHSAAVHPRANMRLVLDHNDHDVLWLEVIDKLRGADELFWNYGSTFTIPEGISVLLHGR